MSEKLITQYSQWIRADADGLTYQMRTPLSADNAAILREARANIKAALELVEHRLQHMEPV
jgi:hypothetical protein